MPNSPHSSVPGIPTDKIDYLQLWQYFEDRGSSLKDSFPQMRTWILGFAGAMIAFAADKTLNWKPGESLIANRLTLAVVFVVGLGLVVFALRVVAEFGEHINRNFDRAERARAADASLKKILDSSELPEAQSKPCPASVDESALSSFYSQALSSWVCS